MSRNLLSHIFSSVLHLERTLSEIQSLLDEAPNSNPMKSQHAQNSKVVRQMRTTANRLQFAFAADDAIESHRLISIFYALNQMVRPEIMKMLGSLLNPNLQVRDSAQQQSAH